MRRTCLVTVVVIAALVAASAPAGGSSRGSGGQASWSLAEVPGSCEFTVSATWSGYPGTKNTVELILSPMDTAGGPILTWYQYPVPGKSATVSHTFVLSHAQAAHGFVPGMFLWAPGGFTLTGGQGTLAQVITDSCVTG